jgi:hypothetical protein
MDRYPHSEQIASPNRFSRASLDSREFLFSYSEFIWNSFLYFLYTSILAPTTDILGCFSGVSVNYFCELHHTANSANRTLIRRIRVCRPHDVHHTLKSRLSYPHDVHHNPLCPFCPGYYSVNVSGVCYTY